MISKKAGFRIPVRLTGILLGLMLVLGSTASMADEWPYGAASETILGTLALVTGPGPDSIPGARPSATEATIYACGRPACEEGPPLTVRLRRQRTGDQGQPLTTTSDQTFVTVDLPPGEYRLAELTVPTVFETGPAVFNLRVHYIFKVREGRISYLGRLEITALDTEAQLIWAKSRGGRIVSGRATEPRRLKKAFHLKITDQLQNDSALILRANPQRMMFNFTSDPMVWMSK